MIRSTCFASKRYRFIRGITLFRNPEREVIGAAGLRRLFRPEALFETKGTRLALVARFCQN
jgi:hypothetical protein